MNEASDDTGGVVKRTTVPELDAILGQPRSALDHGFVRVIDYMGSDAAIVQAARVSYGSGTRSVSDDTALIRYLLRHSHTTPFEMCEIKLHVKLPIFVARQWIRHRTANVNEYSGRYSIIDNEFYVPSAAAIAAQSGSNRQGRGATVDDARAATVQDLIRSDSEKAYASYEELLGGEGTGKELGIARELARVGLGVNFYTQWYWKTDLHNLMHFLKLRADRHAQHEIRVYALLILDILKLWVPITHRAFLDYRLNAVTLSAQALAVVRKRLSGAEVSFQESGLSRREWDELEAVVRQSQGAGGTS